MEAVCAYYRANLEAPLRRPVVPVPTTIIHGGQDGCISPLAYRDLESFFPASLVRHFLPAEVEQVPEVGHWPHLESPRAVNAQILAALKRG
jgi:pimeloyl-ACP methyl ester carboxylesterase